MWVIGADGREYQNGSWRNGVEDKDWFYMIQQRKRWRDCMNTAIIKIKKKVVENYPLSQL
jgi:hypothetical protein